MGKRPDTQAFLALLARLAAGGASDDEEAAAARLFDWRAELVVSRAPGRLDVMGGIADYSGAMVLQLPIAEACFCAAQLGPGDGVLRVVSLGAGTARTSAFELPASALLDAAGAPLSYEEVRGVLAADAPSAWAAYPLGVVHVLAREAGASFAASGLRLLLSSAVPEGKGASERFRLVTTHLLRYSSSNDSLLPVQESAAALPLKLPP
jgi:L-arabinokinase